MRSISPSVEPPRFSSYNVCARFRSLVGSLVRFFSVMVSPLWLFARGRSAGAECRKGKHGSSATAPPLLVAMFLGAQLLQVQVMGLGAPCAGTSERVGLVGPLVGRRERRKRRCFRRSI